MDFLIFAAGRLFNTAPWVFSLSLVAWGCLSIYRIVQRRQRRIRAYDVADQEAIEACLRKWREFRPDIMPRIYADLALIRQTENVVCVGHLYWLLEKLVGSVPVEEKPPRMTSAQ
jgi:hypothetical protein